MDALLNYETVALCGNGPLEVRQYDTSLTQYQVRAAGQKLAVCWVMQACLALASRLSSPVPLACPLRLPACLPPPHPPLPL